jgi:hypothetical protein
MIISSSKNNQKVAIGLFSLVGKFLFGPAGILMVPLTGSAIDSENGRESAQKPRTGMTGEVSCLFAVSVPFRGYCRLNSMPLPLMGPGLGFALNSGGKV